MSGLTKAELQLQVDALREDLQMAEAKATYFWERRNLARGLVDELRPIARPSYRALLKRVDKFLKDEAMSVALMESIKKARPTAPGG